MQFVDACFSITPLSGRVWAHSEVDVVVCFTPEVAHLYSCCAFLEIAGQAARLPLQLRGQGIGPKAKVVYNELLDFGDVFINDERTRDFTIQNKGEIPAEFELIPLSMPVGTTLSVHPSHGTLAVNAMLKIEVTFFSQELGEAFHHIRFSMQGSDEQLTVRFKANVIPPVFHFDVDQVDFGAVSYSFPQTRTVKLINASKIAMKYSLRIPEEASYKQKELELVPSDGKLDSYGEQQITIRFTSHNVKTYQYQLVVGVTGVGADLLSIPVRAQCFVPELTILRHELDFGRCFLRYPHKQMLELENKSTHLYGRFEIGEQDDHSRAIATYSASEFAGSVGPGERVSVEIALSCEKLGSIRLPMVVTVPGSTDLPLSVTLSATGSGPKVELDQPEINWGNCTCLVNHERVLRMTNVSLIPASYKTFIRNARSKFQIDRKEGMLMAGESMEFVLVANLDDTVVFKDQLHILITEGENLVVPLSIRGTGTTMWSPSELRVIDFSHQMTSKECEWSCTLENKGKRVQVLTWVNKTVANANSKISSADQGGSSKKGSKVGLDSRSTAKTNKSGSSNRSGSGATAGDGRDEVIPVFSVFPGTIELKPRTACIFVFKGLSSTAGLIQEELVCETRVGKEKANKVAFVTAIRANFVDPKLTPSSSLLSFEYIHHPGNQITTQSQPLSLTNVCELPLSFTLRTQTPFALDCWEAVLQPGEKVDLNVEFYPGFKDDYTCRVINGKVLVSYTGHPQKDSVELLGDISFPNLSFETTKIDFGCTLNDTQKSISLNVTNVSKVDTSFRWVFIEDEKEALSTATAKKPYIPINQVFDILPIRGLLKPSESEKIEFVYYGHANRKFKSTVACEVEGGPEYELTLSGEASSLVYKLDKQSLDFGQVLYNKTEDRDFSILNVGKVPFSFNIIVDHIACGRTLEISPMSGKIAPNEKQRILVRLRPGIPEYFEETVMLEIAHFQPIQFKLVGIGTFAAVSLNLPRENHPASLIRGEAPKWKELKKRAKQNIELGMLNAAASTLSTTYRGNEKYTSVTSVPASPQAKAVGQRLGAPGSPVRGGAAALAIDELDVEIEACRLFFADHLLVQEQKRADSRALKSAEPSNEDPANPAEPVKVVTKPARPVSSTSETRAQKKRGTEVFPFILSQFVLDFGNVVVGTHKIKRFSVTNIGHGPASFQLDKNLASSRGFQIEPERVVRLPEKQSVEFTVTFHARKNIEMGLHMAQLPIVIKNGPPCIAMVRALVTVPDISISTESLDFGKIAVSTCHTMFTQLQNVSAVPAEWAFKKPMGSTKDVGNFRFTPQSGLLTPGAKVNIQIEFVPDDGRQFMLKLPIKINSNPKTRSIVCRGEGSDLRISFYPPLVELGPVLPCAPPEEQLVEIRNDSDYAVEVFSLDFDSSYEQDEALLRSLSAFTSGDTLQLPIRVPGQSITEYLADNCLLLPPRKGIDYIVVGPPRCGKSTQARLLAEKESLSVWTIDGAVRAVCAAEGPLATAVRKALGPESVSTKLARVLDQICVWRLAQPDLKGGSILDGFDNSFLSFEQTLKCCAKVFATARIILLGFDEDCYESMSALLTSQEIKPGAIVSVTPSPSRDRLTPSSSGNIRDNSNNSDENNQENADENKVLELARSLSADVPRPSTFAEYTQALEAMKHQLALFLLRGDDSTSQPPQTSPDSPSKENSADALWAQVKDRTTPDNFLLEIPILEVGPPLLVHSLIFSTIEKFVRELEASHLPIPSAAKFQLVRRPPERFTRKRIARFSLRSPSVLSASASEASSEKSLHLSSSHSQVPSKHSSRPPTAGKDPDHHQASRDSSSSSPACRWVIAPHSRVNVLVQFASADVGNFDCSMGFEISRPEGAFVQKKFVMSRNQFEFGPLIIGNQAAKPPETDWEFLEWQKSSPNNVEVFRMSNSSKFPIYLELGLEKKDDNVFAVFPPTLEIKEGDTKEVKVWANPSENGLQENALICCIGDNPEPVVFQISCYGCIPELKLRGPWEQPAAASTSERDDHRQAPDVEEAGAPVSARSSVPGSAPVSSRSNAPPVEQPTAPSHSPDQPLLDFEQLLLKRQDEKTFYIENLSPVAVCWRLLGEDLPADFRIFPVEGTIKPLQKVPVIVVFSATTEAVHQFPLRIEFSDAESALRVSDRNRLLELTLCGEAYKIDVSSFDSGAGEVPSQAAAGAALSTGARPVGGDGSLDFGLVRVGEKHSRSFNIRNRGKYNVKYIIAIRSAATREYFTIDPSEMVLEPGQSSSVNVTFTSKSEVTLRDCKDIKCTIIEMLSGEACREFYVYTSARSVFSKFRLQPNRGINFGPHKYSDQAQTKRIEIRNDGEFPFKFRVQGSRPASASEKQETLMIDTPIAPSTLTLGQFAITPDCGTVDPGVTAGLDVVFQPKDCAVYSETLRIEISGRNTDDAAETGMLLYELVGESCYPGINTTDYESIFEEQTVVRSLGVESAMPSSTLRSGAFPGSIQAVTFAEKEKVFSFGPLIAAANWKGTVERFKISNLMKVSCTVQFSIVTGLSSSGEEESEEGSQAFTVQPAVWEIPPLEHRFVSVYFRPTTIALFHATFRAKVDDSPHQSNVADRLLEFEMRGEGTMPCVTVTEPTSRESTGALVVDFGRVRTSKAKDMRLALRNDGILPATVLFSIQTNPNFLFALGNGSVVVPPKATETLTLQFRPQKVHDEPTTSQLKLTVQNNPFEETTFKLFGTGYREDLVFEDLPRGHDAELYFDDIRLPDPSSSDDTKEESAPLNDSALVVKDTKVFSLCNQSSDIVRFEWPKADPFHFSPGIGHLKPKAHKLIRATFEPGLDGEKAIIFQAHRIGLQAQRISYKGSSASQSQSDESGWDESIQTISFDGKPGAVSVSKQAIAEPEFDTIGTPATIALSCFAAADVLFFECDTTSIAFRKTFMLQVCTHRITVHNKSKIKLVYSWRWEEGHPGQSDAVGYPPIYAGIDDNCPFVVTPESGVIEGEESQAFTIKFAPMEVDEYFYWLCFDVPDALGDKSTALKVDVRGGSLRPACHFDVKRSDYAQWRAPNLAGPHGELGPLDPSVKVIEMESLGVRVRNTRRFYVVNPTNVSYEFSWMPQGETNPCFRCATPKGLMLAGKRCEMIFEFTPQQLELQEMFWFFKIPHFQVNQLFLFVGTTTEPRVALDRGSVNFNTLLIGTKTSQSIALVNQEHIPFNFVFDKTSLDFAGEVPALIVHPLSGVIPPNSRTSIEIEFIPTEEKSYSFNLNCIIKRKPTRLSLNVKGEGYSIHDALTLASDDHNESRALLPGPGNVLDFGAVRVNEEAHRSVVIHNSGKFNFDFNWSVAKQPAAFSIEPMQGTIKKNDKATCRLVFAPTKQTSVDGTQATCTVAGSRNYVVALQGNAVPPMLQFSFTSHDFGPCFIAENDSAPMAEVTTLTVFNMDPESGIDLDCLFEKKPHLRVECPPTVLGPRETINIPIVFTARQEVAYLEVVPFTINGSSTVNVSIRGEGVYPKVELVNSSMQMVVLGNLQIGQQASRTAKIANRSKRKTVVECVDSPQPGVPSLEALGISIFPQHELSLRAKESADIEFRFAPTQRIPSFQKDVFIRVDSSVKKLLTLSGCCQGIEVGLETDTLSYGAVCLGSQLVRKVRLQNRGDVATKFQWSVREFAPDFLVSPVEGMVAPNQHKTIEVTFKPAAVNPDIRYERVTCMIDGTVPATLTLVGSCVPQATSSIQDVHFDSAVRQESHKAIAIENATAFPWNLFPVVQGDHWSCPENVLVPAHGKANLDVLYLPLTMTKQNSQEEIDSQRPSIHKGSIFLAIPDGSALLYNVLGKASAPLPAPAISLSTAAKKTLSISVPIKNWLKTPQTFAVDIQKPPGLESVVVQGPSSILLHAGVTRNYNMKFFCYTEGTVDLALRFVNQESGEYLAQDVRVAVAKAVDVDTLYFDAPVRQSVKKTVSIENPFERQRQINFLDKVHWWKCSSPSIRVRQINEISGRSEGSYEIEYRPTLHSETPIEDRLTISFVELGEYTYNLVLSTQSVGPERILYFKAPLGGSQTQTFSFTSYAETATELSCSVQDPTSFSVPTSCKVEGSPSWEGKQESILIKFEPEAIGEFRDTLTLYSDSVGEYKCTLQGMSVPPLPQGPFVFSASKDIEFKNVFSTPKDFEIMVDNPRFVVSTASLSIPAKSSRAITVKIDQPAPSSARGEKLTTQGGASETGKLFVSCPQLKELPPWVYYLEATTP
ncbi:hypothetical protein PHYSODRAFT_470288 [Phytophthora sojae]|uniref:Uncharacterized protein n=1 Tax=Phytophthora sojae (strain P6497) TaxID=1094619 RepID=G4YFM7_PHYSP|nr:hypothetical protein PHYSODRAFT_470288 [Phytophthora sojae]EGZ27382.1 hypothetical protein PHYSODRAFT_470288 [Phytophthora sojae]|eukprot:XP_009514657.1 hypothetical protein PHYSODRAFT_470288 [Phytophthora sojae]